MKNFKAQIIETEDLLKKDENELQTVRCLQYSIRSCRLPCSSVVVLFFCLTSKMSHGGKWREPCVSRDRDIYRSWLHRMVRLSFVFLGFL